MVEPLTITAAILSCLIIAKEAFFEFVGSKTERQVDRLISGLIAEQEQLNEHLGELIAEMRARS